MFFYRRRTISNFESSGKDVYVSRNQFRKPWQIKVSDKDNKYR